MLLVLTPATRARCIVFFGLLACATPAPPPLSEPSPALAAALADTGTATRLYTADEVAKPVMTRPANAAPNWGREDGEARARFVVDTTGQADVATLEFVQPSQSGLGQALRRILPEWRFYPARLADGRAVRQLTEVTVTKRGMLVQVHARAAWHPRP